MKEIIRCKRCIMDNSSDNTITFDENGFCNYCTIALKNKKERYYPNEEGAKKLNDLFDKIKENGVGKKYDCLMGVSGGLDSSYLLYLGYKWGLRIIAVHVDDGFDTEISKNNIQKLYNATKCDLIIIKPDSEQFNDLTKAYMKAGVPNLALPQDNVLFAEIYKYAKENDINYFLSGDNFALECILQMGNTHPNSDLTNIKDIHKKFGLKPINKLNFISQVQLDIKRNFTKLNFFTPLNYIDYNRDSAFKELSDFCGFDYYGSKHLENILTAFVQLYWFPKKFGVDKRTSHLSSMIISDQMSREQALEIYKQPLYDEIMMSDYIKIIKNKLNILDEEFDAIMNAPSHQHTDYKVSSYFKIKPVFGKLKKLANKLFGGRYI